MRSAQSARKYMPDIEIELYCTLELKRTISDEAVNIFTQIYFIDEPSFKHRPRFDACKKTMLEEAIFIDGDTLFVQPCYELFDLLAHFDIALAIAPQLHHRSFIASAAEKALPRVSLALPEYNTGLIVAKNDVYFQKLISIWEKYFSICIENSYHMDQASFRIALAESSLRVATLSNNYNFRCNTVQSLSSNVKVLHCHGELETIAETINLQQSIRLYTPDLRLIHGFKPKL